MVEFGQHITFQGIGFKSAGDHPRRAPTEVKISIFNAMTNTWQEIGFRKLQFGLAAWKCIAFPELAGSTHSVLFHFVNHHGLNEIQLGEIIFYHM